MPELTTLVAGDAQASVSPGTGGSLASFRFRGVDVLRPTSAEALAQGNVRGFACYPLVPWSNRIADARLHVGDGTFALERNFGDHPHAIHGVGWQRAWRTVAGDARSLAIEFAHAPEPAGIASWPFAFRARQAFALDASDRQATLTLRLSIESEDARAFPFGLGFHPFFVKPAGTRLAFRARGVWLADPTRLPTRWTEPPAECRFDAGQTVDGADLDHVFTGWDGSARIEWPERALAASIEADRALSHLVVFVPPDQRHLAVEPVSHMTDAFNRAAAGESGTGTRTLAPGQSFSCTMRITVAATPS